MTDRYSRIATPPAEYAKRVLGDSALERAPKAVKDANAAARASLDSHRKATTDQRTADIEARNADRADVQATKTALEAGKAPPKATVNAKRDAAEQAKRTTTAAEALVADKFDGLDHSIREHHAEWIANERATLEAAGTDAVAVVAKASEAFSTFEARTQTVAFLIGYDGDREKSQALRFGSLLLADTDTVQRNPAALMGALSDLATDYVERLTTAETELDRKGQEQARNNARRALRHQQDQERQASAKTTRGFTVG